MLPNSMTQTQPIPVKNKLASSAKLNPEFRLTAKLKDQSDLYCSDPKAIRAAIALMDMNAVQGGAASHYGGPAAFAEIMSVTHAWMFHQSQKQNKEWFEAFHFVNDAGHCENGLYALKANYKMAGLNWDSLKKFRSIESKLTGHGEAHLFPEGVLLSNGPLGSALPQAQGLAIGDKLAGNSRITVTAISDGACMEGEAREALAAIPGLAAKGQVNPFVLIISDNNTKLSGRIDQESFSMAPTFQALSALGWKVIELKDAHNLQNCLTAFEQAIDLVTLDSSKPVAIHAKTIKGIGSKKAAESSSGGHGFPLKSAKELPEFIQEIYGTNEYPAVFKAWIEELIQWEKDHKTPSNPGEKIQVGVAKAMIKAKKAGFPVVSVTSDLPGSTGVAAFRKEFPESSIDVGIAESNMISVGAGLFKTGFIPVVDTFAQFGVTKGSLPLTMASLSQAGVIGIFSHTGFQDAADGASHQGLNYLSMVGGIPSVNCFALSCAAEAEQLVYQAIERQTQQIRDGHHPQSYLFFLGRENFPTDLGASKYVLGHAQVLQSHAEAKTVIVAAGSLAIEAMHAAKQIEAKGQHVTVIHPSVLNSVDIEFYRKHLEVSGGRLVIAEDHQMNFGFGQFLVAKLVEAGVSVKPKILAVKGKFGQSAYLAAELYRLHGLDSQSIIEAAD